MKYKQRSKLRLARDLAYLYDRLDHLSTVHEEGCMGRKDFSGPNETMEDVNEKLVELRKRYGFEKCWPEGRVSPKKK